MLPFVVFAQKNNFSEKPQNNGRIYAIIIGVADYTTLPKLEFADKDALEFYLYLRKLSPPDTNRFFIFLNKNATQNAIAGKFYHIMEKSRPGDKVFIYFSGHGDIEQLRASDDFFLLLGGCGRKDYMKYSNNTLEKRLFDRFVNELLFKKVNTIFICDACHSGKLIGGEKGKKIVHETLLKNHSSGIQLLSCQPNQTSLESTKWGEGRSLFSYYLVLGLKGLADMNRDKRVSLSEISHYLTVQVKEGARIFNQEQWPSMSGDKDFAISKTSDLLMSQASLQNKQNSSSSDYKSLATEKGKKIKVNNNLYIFKNRQDRQSGFLQMERNVIPTDRYLQTIYFSFKDAIQAGNLVSPEQGSGSYYYKLLQQKTADSVLLEETKITLLNALLQSYDELLGNFYNNEDSIFYNILQSYSPHHLELAMELYVPVDIMVHKIKSKQLFLQACMLTPLQESVKNRENTRMAIELLQEAARLDSLHPAVYAKLSELYWVQQHYEDALDACGQYLEMLPNDAHMYNKKGLIYLSLQQHEQAISEFNKALQLEPEYTEAQANLQKAQQKKQ